MNPLRKIIGTVVTLVILSGPISADMAPQPQMAFTSAAPGTFAADWQGVEGRVYFMQWSMDLTTWFYAPVLGFGDGMHSCGLAGSASKCSFRLHYGEYPEITTLDEARNADFDADGLSNVFEVSFGYDPYNASSTVDGSDNSLDPEGDGLTNATENTKGLNPMRKDNPKLLLQVTVE